MKASKFLQQMWLLAPGLLALFLPWSNGTNAAVVLNAWDLAEWSSLHPLSRNADPALAVSFGLRALPLFLLALTLWRAGLPILLRAALAALVAVALLPPPQYFFTDLADPNYRQQLLLSIAALLIGLVSAWRRIWLHWLQIILPLMAPVMAWISVSAALDLQRSLELKTGPGVGLALFALTMLVNSMVVVLTRKGRSTRDRPT